jgi:hypothetical protein
MTLDASSDSADRRARLIARRRRRAKLLWAVTAIAAVAVGVTMVAFALGDVTPAQSRSSPPPRNQLARELPLEAARKSPEQVRALNHAQPLRLWVGGDSLAGSFGPTLGDMVGATGVVSTQIDYKVSSGLSSNDLRNWYARATQQMSSVNPEAVVFIIGTNDASIVNKMDSNRDGVPDWEPDYRAKVGRMMDTFVGASPHRTVFWIGAPTLENKTLDDGVVALDRVMKEEAAKRAPSVVFVDGYKLFSAADGGYTSYLTDENGHQFRARIGDGVHFTIDGAQYLAKALFQLIDTRWHVRQQADRAHPIAWTLAEGSGEAVPGISTNATSHTRKKWTPTPTTYRYRHYSSTTTPMSTPPTSIVIEPPTAPPTTSAPPPPVTQPVGPTTTVAASA